MSDSEGSDSDGSYGGRKKMRRDEAEEVTTAIHFLNLFTFLLLQGEEEDVADEQEPEGEDLVGGEDDSDEEVSFDDNLIL